jgi:Zn-dependent protease with chaperone function
MTAEAPSATNPAAYPRLNLRWKLIHGNAQLLFLLGLVAACGFVEERLCLPWKQRADWVRLGTLAVFWVSYLILMIPITWRQFSLVVGHEPAPGAMQRPRPLRLGILTCATRSASAALPAALVILAVRYPTFWPLRWAAPLLLCLIQVAGAGMIRREFQRTPSPPLQPIGEAELAAELDDFARRQGFRNVQVHACQVPMTADKTAATCRRDGEGAEVVLKSQLLDLLDRRELLAIFAHELSHLRMRFLSQLTAALTYGWWLAIAVAVGALPGLMTRGNRFFAGPLSCLSILILAGWLVWFFCLPIQLAMSRLEERLANQHAVRMTGSAGPLISAVRKLARLNPGEVPAPWWQRLFFAAAPTADQVVAQVRHYAARRGIAADESMQPPGGNRL